MHFRFAPKATVEHQNVICGVVHSATHAPQQFDQHFPPQAQ
jgi:hypothetical protein